MDNESSHLDRLREGTGQYYLARLAPRELRNDIALLLAWHTEITAIADIADPNVARIKLAWWRDEIDRVKTSKAQHPLSRAVQELVSRRRLTISHFHNICAAEEEQLKGARYENLTDLWGHWRRGSGQLAMAMGKISSTDTNEPKNADHWSEIGALNAASEVIGRLGAEIRRTNPRLPRPIRDALKQRPNKAAIDDAIAGLCTEVLQLCPDHQRSTPKPLRAMSRLAKTRLREVRRSGALVMDAEIDLTPIRKFFIVWRS